MMISKTSDNKTETSSVFLENITCIEYENSSFKNAEVIS